MPEHDQGQESNHQSCATIRMPFYHRLPPVTHCKSVPSPARIDTPETSQGFREEPTVMPSATYNTTPRATSPVLQSHPSLPSGICISNYHANQCCNSGGLAVLGIITVCVVCSLLAYLFSIVKSTKHDHEEIAARNTPDIRTVLWHRPCPIAGHPARSRRPVGRDTSPRAYRPPHTRESTLSPRSEQDDLDEAGNAGVRGWVSRVPSNLSSSFLRRVQAMHPNRHENQSTSSSSSSNSTNSNATPAVAREAYAWQRDPDISIGCTGYPVSEDGSYNSGWTDRPGATGEELLDEQNSRNTGGPEHGRVGLRDGTSLSNGIPVRMGAGSGHEMFDFQVGRAEIPLPALHLRGGAGSSSSSVSSDPYDSNLDEDGYACSETSAASDVGNTRDKFELSQYGRYGEAVRLNPVSLERRIGRIADRYREQRLRGIQHAVQDSLRRDQVEPIVRASRVLRDLSKTLAEYARKFDARMKLEKKSEKRELQRTMLRFGNYYGAKTCDECTEDQVRSRFATSKPDRCVFCYSSQEDSDNADHDEVSRNNQSAARETRRSQRATQSEDVITAVTGEAEQHRELNNTHTENQARPGEARAQEDPEQDEKHPCICTRCGKEHIRGDTRRRNRHNCCCPVCGGRHRSQGPLRQICENDPRRDHDPSAPDSERRAIYQMLVDLLNQTSTFGNIDGPSGSQHKQGGDRSSKTRDNKDEDRHNQDEHSRDSKSKSSGLRGGGRRSSRKPSARFDEAYGPLLKEDGPVSASKSARYFTRQAARQLSSIVNQANTIPPAAKATHKSGKAKASRYPYIEALNGGEYHRRPFLIHNTADEKLLLEIYLNGPRPQDMDLKLYIKDGNEDEARHEEQSSTTSAHRDARQSELRKPGHHGDRRRKVI